MSPIPSSALREEPSNPREGHGLKLVPARPPQPAREAYDRREPSSSLAPLSVSDWAISLGFGAFALAYLAGIALSVRWFLYRLFGA
jgi:hypothetical protein